MKKLLIVLMVATMIFGVSVYAFADDTDTTVCEVSPEYVERFLEIKTEFINQLVADGTLDEDTAAVMLSTLETQTGSDTLKDLGFGVWLRDSEYAEEVLDILPHKNMGMRASFGQKSGNCLEDGTYRNMTDEEFEAMREEHHADGLGQRTGGGRGHRNNR
ncbi:MAG: hypothetical protein JEZ08_13740 [Clostridiales bacterium]|nr:hypothetical protein [Clostridiales bacterium]